MAVSGLRLNAPSWLQPGQLRAAASTAAPLLLYGVRLWAAVCLALFVAFALEMQNPFWAGTTAAIVCQPVLGASLRKGWFRMIGTVIGAVVAVLLTACFPQSRAGFLLALAVWGAFCGMLASILRNFASYAAALAGYTTIIICADQLGAVGGADANQAFILAVTRASEICIGIVSAGIVLAGTDLGGARRRLAAVLASLAGEISAGLFGALATPAATQAASRVRRRMFIQRVAALETLIDNAIGEISALRFRPRGLQAAMDGLFTALSAWRALALHIERVPESEPDTRAILSHVPPAFLATPALHNVAWDRDALRLRQQAIAAARTLVALPLTTPSARLLADRTADGLLGLARALNAVLVLEDPTRAPVQARIARLRVPDMLPPLINAVRVFVTIGAAELLWVWTAWPNGAMALVFAAVTVILFSPREDTALATASGFMLGNGITACLAAVAAFAVLPHQPTFAGFCLTIGVVLIPAGALAAQSWRTSMFIAVAANFIPLLGPANPMSYNPESFYNTAIAIVAGIGIAIAGLQLMPPLAPVLRAQRLLTLTLRDLRRLAGGAMPVSAGRWESHVYGRLAALPPQVDLLQGARLVAALSVGSELIRLHRIVGHLPEREQLAGGLSALAQGDTTIAAQHLRDMERDMADCTGIPPGTCLRARSIAREIAEALVQHAAYFEGGTAA